MPSDPKHVNAVTLVLDGQTVTFPGFPITAVASGASAAEVYYEDTPDDESQVTSFGNGDDIPADGRHLASIGEGAYVRHVYAVPSEEL